MSRRHAHPAPIRGEPIFAAVRSRPGWTRLPLPAGLSLVVVGIALAVGGVATVWWLFVALGLLLALLGLL